MTASGEGSGDPTRDYVEKAARSITELQPNVNNLADARVFLEVLGYDDAQAMKAGFEGLQGFAGEVFERVDFYEEGVPHQGEGSSYHRVKLPSARKRLVESLSLAAPWVGALALLYVFGVSLWLALGLGLGPETALMVGVFMGLLVSEGPMQAFTRVFMFYHSQGNVSECARALRRSYAAVALLLSCSVAVIFASAFALRIPWEMVALAAVGAVTIAVHRIGYLPIYALKKTSQVVASYGIALPLLVGVYVLTPVIVPDVVVRYLLSLGAALAVLSVFAWYNTKKSLVIDAEGLVGKDAPAFYRPTFVNVHTINSKFEVQFWETLPTYLSGTFFFILVFGDRILSWFGNPVKVVGGVTLPLVFNVAYHSGADFALAILFPVAIVQYVMLSSVHEELHNRSLDLPVTKTAEVDRFIRMKHAKATAATLASAAVAAALLFVFAPPLVYRLGAGELSVHILYVAALGDLLLAVFVANSSFMSLLNGANGQAAITAAGAAAVVGLGALVLPMGFQYLVYAYLAACALVATLSTAYLASLMKSPSDHFYARFI